jgi:hypothetical protein
MAPILISFAASAPAGTIRPMINRTLKNLNADFMIIPPYDGIDLMATANFLDCLSL